MYKKIFNPIDKKRYSIFSEEGFNILNKYFFVSKEAESKKNNRQTKISNNRKNKLTKINKTYLPIYKLVGINSHPFVLYYFKNLDNHETNKKISSILLIGEEHEFSKYKCNNYEKHCYNINNFQESLFEYINKMGCTLDVFIENYTKNTRNINSNDIYHSFIKTEESMLDSWKNRFILNSTNDFNYLIENNNKGELIKEYSNVFFHLIDLRYMFDKKLNIFVALKVLEINISKIFPWFEFNKKNVKSILTYIICKKNSKNKLDFNSGKDIINRMAKSIDSLIDNKIKTYNFLEFIHLYKNLISIIIKNFNNNEKFINNYINSVITITFVFGINTIFDALDSILMDLYTINKMFINPRKNIVFYGGGWHTMLYCEFIKQHYNKSPDIHSKNQIFDELILENFNYECGT